MDPISTSAEREIRELIRADIPGRFNELDVLKRHYARIRIQDSGEILPPYEVLIHPSSACNLRCAWCIGDHVPIKKMDGSLINIVDASKTAQETLPNELANVKSMSRLMSGILSYQKSATYLDGDISIKQTFKIENISFSGLIGEPLASKDAVIEAMQMAKAEDRRVGIFTNGVLMDDRVRRTFLDIDYVHFSLDAATPETYAWLKYGDVKRGATVYQTALENLKQLIQLRSKQGQSKLKINCSFILYPENYHEVLDAARLLKDMGVDSFRVKHDNSGRRPLSNDQKHHCMQLLDRIRCELHSHDFVFIQIHKLNEELDLTRNFSKCRITDLMAAVGSDGNMYPCNYHPRPGGHSYGSVIDNTFQDVWEGELRQSLKCKLPKICPAVCDPFKTRANGLLQKSADLTKEIGFEQFGRAVDNIEV